MGGPGRAVYKFSTETKGKGRNACADLLQGFAVNHLLSEAKENQKENYDGPKYVSKAYKNASAVSDDWQVEDTDAILFMKQKIVPVDTSSNFYHAGKLTIELLRVMGLSDLVDSKVQIDGKVQSPKIFTDEGHTAIFDRLRSSA